MGTFKFMIGHCIVSDTCTAFLRRGLTERSAWVGYEVVAEAAFKANSVGRKWAEAATTPCTL